MFKIFLLFYFIRHSHVFEEGWGCEGRVVFYQLSAPHGPEVPSPCSTMHSSFLGVDSFSLLFNVFSEGIKAQFP